MNHRLEAATQLTCLDGEPRACYRRWRETLQADEALDKAHGQDIYAEKLQEGRGY